jgi:hypothetical protein
MQPGGGPYTRLCRVATAQPNTDKGHAVGPPALGVCLHPTCTASQKAWLQPSGTTCCSDTAVCIREAAPSTRRAA